MADPLSDKLAEDQDPERLAHFRIVGRIGRGGMGIVYRAEDERLQRAVALKVLPPAFEQDRDRRARFLREARAAAGVTHPNIATVHEIGEADGRVFIAMELVDGRTLRAVLADGPMPAASVLRIATQIARGLGKAHQQRVVHRDLKPDNIMIGEDLHAKILDFGLAKVTAPARADTPSAIEQGETATREGMVLGTPQYMSPEQARGRPVDAASDVFSFGILLYEMATGRRPFDGISVAEVIIAIDRDAPPRATEVNPRVPAALEKIIDRCLEKDPKRRYPDGRALADELAGLVLDAPRSTAPAGPAPASTVRGGMAAGPSPSLLTPGPANMPVQAARRRRWWPAVVGLVLLAGWRSTHCSGGGGDGGSKGGKGAVAASASQVAAVKPVTGAVLLACPQLEASGVEEPSGWLGAAAADVTCRRAAILMGGRMDRVQVPADLLDLPHQPTDDFPRDPYGAPGSREREIVAAKARAAAWLDGSVEKKGDGFHVKLVVREPDGDDVEQAEGRGHHVYLAVADAMRSLVKHEAIEKAEQIDPEISRWTGIKDVDLALEVDDWHDSLASSPVSTKAAMARLAARRGELGPVWPHMQWESQLPTLTEATSFDPVILDRSSPAAFALSAVSYAETVHGADAAALAAEVAKLRDAETSTVGRRALLLAQADILVAAGEMPQAVELALGELREEPRSDHTWEVPVSLPGQANLGPVARAFAAWMPEDHAAWNYVSTGDATLKDTAARVPFARRAYAISPDFPIWGDTLGKQLVQMGRPEEARSVGTAMLNVGAFMDPAAQSILVLVDASEAHFGAAVRRGVEALDRLDTFGMQLGDWYLIDALVAASAVVQAERTMGDDFAKRFALVDPPRIAHGEFFGGPLVLAAADACVLASRDVSRRCFSRLRQLLAAHYFPSAEPTAGVYLDGCDRYAQGDLRGAAAAWRPLVTGHAADAGFAGNSVARFGPIAFDAAGEHELAVRIDAQNLATGFDSFGGASPAHAREAHRALARADAARARELAQRVVDAWGASDLTVPSVAEMRALLATAR